MYVMCNKKGNAKHPQTTPNKMERQEIEVMIIPVSYKYAKLNVESSMANGTLIVSLVKSSAQPHASKLE